MSVLASILINRAQVGLGADQSRGDGVGGRQDRRRGTYHSQPGNARGQLENLLISIELQTHHLVLTLRLALIFVHAQVLGRLLGLALALLSESSIGSIGGGVVESSVVTHCGIDVRVVDGGQVVGEENWGKEEGGRRVRKGI